MKRKVNTSSIKRAILAGVVLLTLSGCGTSAPEKQPILTPMPLPSHKPAIDPTDAQFMQAISEYVRMQGGPANTRYQFTRLDLNYDGRREGLVLLTQPNRFWCNSYGCPLIIFKAHDQGFTVLSEIKPVRGPLIVMDSYTQGWHDILARVSGRTGWDAKDVVLRFNGRTYPQDPSLLHPSAARTTIENGTEIFP